MAKADFLHGSVIHGLLNFMVPVLGALLLQAAYGAADVFVIGMFWNDGSHCEPCHGLYCSHRAAYR